jgi:hypothetical protein
MTSRNRKEELNLMLFIDFIEISDANYLSKQYI